MRAAFLAAVLVVVPATAFAADGGTFNDSGVTTQPSPNPTVVAPEDAGADAGTTSSSNDDGCNAGGRGTAFGGLALAAALILARRARKA